MVICKNDFNIFLLRVCLTILLCFVFYQVTDGEATNLNNANFNLTINSYEIAFINFYADWCRFSQILDPIFNEAADEIKRLYDHNKSAIMARVNCDHESELSSSQSITKYPTLKLFRNGKGGKKEYRGARTKEGFVSFIQSQLIDNVNKLESLIQLKNLDISKTHIIGFFDSKDQIEYENLRKVAGSFNEHCKFHAGIGDAFRANHPPGQPIVVFRPDIKTGTDVEETYKESLLDFNKLYDWVNQKCVPLVREITFENAEELTEEGLPFLILFYHPSDTESINEFKRVVHEQLSHRKHSINFLIADGERFAHPLHHLGKSKKDLPVIAIDSFRHMYLFENYARISIPGELGRFLDDLSSGKLHREYHYGPDKSDDTTEFQKTTPPESTFKKLAPSKNRYTLMRDEL